MSFSRPNPALAALTVDSYDHQQPVRQGVESEAPNQAVGDGAKIARDIGAATEGMTGSTDTVFGTTEDRIHPVTQKNCYGLCLPTTPG